MFVFCLPRPLSINDLQKDKKLAARLRAPAELRKSIKIAVIDDQPFAPEQLAFICRATECARGEDVNRGR